MSESVKVAVRCRPMNHRELQHKCRSVVTVDGTSRSCSLAEVGTGGGNGKVYQFDAAFGPEIATETVYEELGSYVVEAVLEGYNGTVFAYGQTGCGKSHTMRGFIERALEHLFEATSTASSDTRYLALLTYLEIYNEKLRDLLQPGAAEQTENLLHLKEDPVRGTYVAGGLREVTVKDARECARLVEQGDRRRAAAATKMNAASSRSHAVLTISLEAIAIGPEMADASSAVRRGRLHLVDLAGSERQGRTGATGDRLKEAASINLSLSALGNVISALAAGNGRHVPYRDSKLTRLLRDSLGGNARTLMIACVSPSDADAEETLSTLRYAARARCIKNKPIVNEDPKDALLRQYQLELQRLRKLLESSNSETGIGAVNADEQQQQRTTIATPNAVASSDSRSNDRRASLQTLKNEAGDPVSEVLVLDSPPNNAADPDEREERRRRKREAAKQEVLRRLERLTIGGEALGDVEIRRRRERRRRRLQALAEALETSSKEGSGAAAFEVYGQLKSTEDALKRMAKRAKQLEAEAADLQASWDEERRELLRRELLAQQICDAMIPHLRPGCPLRDVAAIRAAASWCTELGRWRLPDVSSSSSRIPLPPASLQSPPPGELRSDLNGNGHVNSNNDDDPGLGLEEDNDELEESSESPARSLWHTAAENIADRYFKRRSRLDEILARVREAKSFDGGGRASKSGSSSEETQAQLVPINAPNAMNGGGNGTNGLQKLDSLFHLGAGGGSIERLPKKVGGWISEDSQPQQQQQQQQQQQLTFSPDSPPYKRTNGPPPPLQQPHPRVLEALPSYPQISIPKLQG
ncbi:osmotic avoidance abnormal protein 3-like [Trichogramma pretiosum]|uniref:osmotic avoidance abnormal protein 3-like n=1 Tax=Trichogramma pretiosum TaxID=7493 RepID=UPI000C71B526|nr:osmotic avoidance abnormal protein 3-like [Trichogramma pretiosum]